MNPEIISIINEKTDIVSLVEPFVKLEKRGRNYMGLCPFHDEKTPSFSVSPEKNLAKCMGCGEGGLPLTFYRKIKNISFKQAVYELGTKLGLSVDSVNLEVDPFESLYNVLEDANTFYQFSLSNTKGGQEALKYLTNREMSMEMIEHFGIGHAPKKRNVIFQFLKDKGHNLSDMIRVGLVNQSETGDYYDIFSNRIMFPITNQEGRVAGFSARALAATDKVKYINSPETEIFKKGKLLYHFFESQHSVRRTGQVFLYEGFFDVISPFKAGMTNGVATMGTALTIEQAQLIKSIANHVIIAYDGDKAGVNASLKAIEIFTKLNLKVEILDIPDRMDPDDYIKNFGPEGFVKLLDNNLKDPFQFRFDNLVKNTDFKNVNDVNSFTKEIMIILRTAPNPVRDYYFKKVFDKYNISLQTSSTTTIAPPPIKREPSVRESNVIVKVKQNQAIDAEIQLIIALLYDSPLSDFILEQYSLNDGHGSIISGKVLNKIVGFKKDYSTLEAVMTLLLEDERQFMNEQIYLSKYYARPEIIMNANKSFFRGLFASIKKANYRSQLEMKQKELKKGYGILSEDEMKKLSNEVVALKQLVAPKRSGK